MPEQYEVLVGIDWATQSHQVCVGSASGEVLEEREVEHDAGAIARLVNELLERAGGAGARIAVGIEVPRGGLVETLLERGLHVYALNPKQTDRFRDRHSMSGAKDDRRDAFVIFDALRTDLGKFRRVDVDDPLVIQLREVSRADEDLRQEANRLTNRLREQLYRALPHLLTLSPSANEPWFWELAERTLARPQARMSTRQVERVMRSHRIRRLLTVLRQPPISVAPGTIEAVSTHVALLVPRLRIVDEQRKECAKRLRALLDAYAPDDPGGGAGPSEPSDVQILRSLPGIGIMVASTLLAESATLLARRDRETLRSLAGIAPVTKSSGKRRVVMMRYGANQRLRNAFYHWARTSVQHDEAAHTYYARLRARGHTHGRALRSVADRWLRVLMAMLTDRTLYDPEHARVPCERIPVMSSGGLD
jgi:transposase